MIALLLFLFACGGSRPAPVPVDNDPQRVPDVNGDGLADVLVPLYRESQGARANIAVWLGPAEGDPLFVPVQAMDGSLYHATFVGDVDGDGFSDTVFSEEAVGAPSDALLLPGSPEGPVADSGLWLTDPGTDSYGARAFWAGDVDADGLGDLVVLRSWTMSVHLGAGGVAGAPETVWQDGSPAFTSMGDAWRSGRIGEVLALGDVTGDGRDDLLVWWYALRDNTNTFVETWAYVVPGPLDGSEWIPIEQVFPGVYGNHNVEVASLGDPDGDGIVDLGIADPNQAQLWSSQGWERVDGVLDSAGWQGMGDLNADGFPDLAWSDGVHLGGPERIAPGTPPDHVFPLPTSPDDPSITPENLQSWRYGLWGAGAGDVDGDGYDDFVAASDVDAWLWYGGPDGGRDGQTGHHLFTNYMQPAGLAVRAGAP